MMSLEMTTDPLLVNNMTNIIQSYVLILNPWQKQH